MKYSSALFFCFIFSCTMAQQAAEAVEGNYSLKERYGIMKSKSQTFKDYKVIKETVLDGVWKIVLDSVGSGRLALQQANYRIDTLKASVADVKRQMQAKEEEVAEVIHDSTHIDVLGIAFHKGVFLSAVGITLGVLIFFLVTVIARLKVIRSSLQERKLAVNMITHEYEDYKRKAMDKQMKLSRELQDERNKLQALRSTN